ncbi:MAG: hypothetical protein KC550_01700 [Nanoarchaeota archaeon]|nr:hypothetical protein [Nanoarchaeota archaeon]
MLNYKDKIIHIHHWYQPPWQFPKTLAKIVDECYRPMSEFYSKVENFKVAVNINYSLTSQLIKYGHIDVIENLKLAAKKGNIEFLGSASNHAFGPLTPKAEFIRQIEQNEQGNRKVFGNFWKDKTKRGFFPPEMGFNPELASLIKSQGFAFSVASGITLFDVEFPSIKIAKINNLPMYFRADDWSNIFSMDFAQKGTFEPKEFVDDLGDSLHDWFANRRREIKIEYKNKGLNPKNIPDNYLLLAFDVETMGHHHKGYNQEFMFKYAKALNEKGFESVLPIEYLKSNPNSYELIKTKEDKDKFHSSWSTEIHHLENANPFPLWTPSNPINNLQHKLVDLANDAVKKAKRKNLEIPRSREILDFARNSCKLWWANEGYLWNPTYLLIGAAETLQVFYALELETKKSSFNHQKYLNEAEEIFNEIKQKIKEKDPNAIIKDLPLPDYFIKKDMLKL